MRLGYPCISLLTDRTTNHSCMLKSATPEKLRSLIRENLDELKAILRHNLEHNWLLFRIGSSVIPFGSHPVNTVPWWNEFKPDLNEIGRFARQHDLRLSFHPGQYTVLNSNRPDVVSRAIAELTYSTRFLDELGLDSRHKVIIHIGGVYGDKSAAVDRFCDTAADLDDAIRRRLVIENDERSYTPADTLAISNRTGLPVIFDNLHYQANPGEGELDDLLGRVFATWNAADGVPKVHFSTQAPDGRTGHHADDADPDEFDRWMQRWLPFGDFDVMLEAKNKDIALQKLTRGGKYDRYLVDSA